MYIDRIVHKSMDSWRLIMYTTIEVGMNWGLACLLDGAAQLPSLESFLKQSTGIVLYDATIRGTNMTGKRWKTIFAALIWQRIAAVMLRTTGSTNLRGNWGCPWNISKLKFKCPRLSVSPSNSIQVTADWSISANIFRGHDQNNPYRLSVCASSEQATRFQDVPRTSTCSSHCKKSVISNRFIPD